MAKTRMPLEGEFSAERISDLIACLEPARVESLDGVKAVFDDGWFHVRVSNTEGVVRVMAESMSEERTGALLSAAKQVLDESWG